MLELLKFWKKKIFNLRGLWNVGKFVEDTYLINKRLATFDSALNSLIASHVVPFWQVKSGGWLYFTPQELWPPPGIKMWWLEYTCCQCVDFGCCTECNKNNESGVSEKLSYILWKSIFKTDTSINETAPSNWCNWWRNSFENIDFQRRYDHSSETLVQLCLLQRVLWLCFICHVYSRLHTQSHKKKYKKFRFFYNFLREFRDLRVKVEDKSRLMPLFKLKMHDI
jgi:hypothetical protein